jgi:putative hydrolase of the HAD superfamily
MIKNLIFDLGGVIIPIDIPRTVQAFIDFAPDKAESLRQSVLHSQMFLDFETGTINSAQFRASMRDLLEADLTDAQIDMAWNVLLLDIPVNRIALLARLKTQYRTFLLSNTNEIHLPKVERILQQCAGEDSLDDLFEKAYYSQKMGLRKPNSAIYEQVLAENKLNPAETVFIDDNFGNVAAAKSVGIRGIYLEVEKTDIVEIFDQVEKQGWQYLIG